MSQSVIRSDLSHRDGRRCRGARRENRQRPVDRHLRRGARRNAGAEGARRGARWSRCDMLEPTRRHPFPTRMRPAKRSMRAARPISNFRSRPIGTDLAALMTIAIGGVYSIKGFSGIRIVDMKLPEEFAGAHPGPQFGVAGQPRADRRARAADHRLDRQAGARPAAARDGRTRPRTGRGRRRFHQGRREADEPRLFAPRGTGEGDHADHPRSRAEDRQEGDVRLRHLACRSRDDGRATTISSPSGRQRCGRSTSTRSASAALPFCASARASRCTPIATAGTS